MIKTDQVIYLASKSPRRKKLLNQINLDFQTVDIETPEVFKKNESPVDAVRRIAKEKLEEAKKLVSGIIITADTIVVIDNEILGKPVDEKDAVRLLKKLNGRIHAVYTGYAIYNSAKNETVVGYERTYVTFRKLLTNEIEEYVESGSPMDKAGAYGIQDDYGAVFIDKINGCYYNVVGLPLAKIYQELLRIV